MDRAQYARQVHRLVPQRDDVARAVAAPYPAGIYTHYKVSITPDDAIQSVLYVEQEGEPPGPAQAAFKGLVPGREYNISVQTVSEDETSSVPTTARYLTVPERVLNVTFDEAYTTASSFRVQWKPPSTYSEFDGYQVMLSTSRRIFNVPRNEGTLCTSTIRMSWRRDAPTRWW